MHISAKADYAVRAVVRIAEVGGGPATSESLAQAQDIPQQFLESILTDLRRAGVLRSQRGRDGGYWLGRPADRITIADVIRAVDGPLATVRGRPPEDLAYTGAAEPLQHVWIAVRANLRAVLETVTVADIATDELPPVIRDLTASPDPWVTR